MSEEYSQGGSKIYRHTTEEFKQDFNDLGESSLEEIDSHINRWLGDVSGVFHEIVSPTIHVDVHLVPPSRERNFNILITSGMSDKPMNSPFPEARYAEVVSLLPPEWKLDQASFENEANYWPIRQLKGIARFPHEFNTWVWATHTIPNGDPPEPYAANTGFCCILLYYPVSLPEGFHRLKINDEKEINFLALIPIYKDEMEFKLKNGMEALLGKFDEKGVSEICDISRPSCVKRSWFGGLFK
jgi:hypothetical protein